MLYAATQQLPIPSYGPSVRGPRQHPIRQYDINHLSHALHEASQVNGEGHTLHTRVDVAVTTCIPLRSLTRAIAVSRDNDGKLPIALPTMGRPTNLSHQDELTLAQHCSYENMMQRSVTTHVLKDLVVKVCTHDIYMSH